MGIKPNGILKIWDVDEQVKYTKIQFSTTKRVKDGWETDFSGFALLNGDAKTKLYGKIQKGSTIKITDFDITKKYIKEKNKEYININIWDADLYVYEGKEEVKQEKTEVADNVPSEDFMSIADGVPDLPFN